MRPDEQLLVEFCLITIKGAKCVVYPGTYRAGKKGLQTLG